MCQMRSALRAQCSCMRAAVHLRSFHAMSLCTSSSETESRELVAHLVLCASLQRLPYQASDRLLIRLQASPSKVPENGSPALASKCISLWLDDETRPSSHVRVCLR